MNGKISRYLIILNLYFIIFSISSFESAHVSENPKTVLSILSPDRKHTACVNEGFFEIIDNQSDKTICSWPVPGEKKIYLSWLPNGSRIAFSGDENSELGIWVLDLTSQKTVQVMEGRCYKPVGSEDGSLVAHENKDQSNIAQRSISITQIDKLFSSILCYDHFTEQKLNPCQVNLVSYPPYRIHSFKRSFGSRLGKEIIVSSSPPNAIVPNGLQEGIRTYLDRSYVIASVPDDLRGLPLLQSTMSQNPNTTDACSIVVSSPDPFLVFAAIDERTLAYWILSGILPDWIQEYTSTPYRILSSDFQKQNDGFGYRVFVKRASSGQVLIGAMNFCFFALDDGSYKLDGVKPYQFLDHNIFHSLSLQYFSRNQINESIEYAKKAVHLSPNDTYSQSNLGQIFFHDNQNRPAIQALKKAILLNPKRASVYEMLARVWNKIGDLEEIGGLINLLKVVMDQDGKSLIHMGKMYELCYDYKSAIQTYKESMRLNPNCGAGLRYWIENLYSKLYLFEKDDLRLEHESYTDKSNFINPSIIHELLHVPQRDPDAPSNLIDLSKYYNALLHETWSFRGNFYPEKYYFSNNLSDIPMGIQTFKGTSFDVRGIIQLQGINLQNSGCDYPTHVEGIAIKKHFKYLHALHAAFGETLDNNCVGNFQLHYEDGAISTIDICYGKDIYDSQELPIDPTKFVNAVIAWRGKSDFTRQPGLWNRIYKSTWMNPKPDREVAAIDYVSRMCECSPFLIAITVE